MLGQTQLTTVNISRHFSRAAHQYDDHAVVQLQVAQALWRWAADQLPENFKPESLIDVGCGTGALTREMQRQYPQVPTFAIDIAPGMITQLSQSAWLGDYTVPTLGDGQFLDALDLPLNQPTLLASSMCAQWFDDIGATLNRWLTIADTVAFSVLLDGSFTEWHKAHALCGQPCGLRTLPSARYIDHVLTQLHINGNIDTPVVMRRTFDHALPNGRSFAKSLKAIGANQAKPEHKPASLFPVLRQLEGGLTANYELGFYLLSKKVGA